MAQTNHLAGEQSPYLLQHQFNPVDWYPWGEEAFARARTLDRPIFLSIGYATCHWCHVMERESFEDGEVARLMNDTFVSVKVDREERPDIDSVYMHVCQALTGQGGWPLTIVMTPDRQPFYAATYIPKHARHGRPGMMELIPRIGQLWGESRERLVASAAHVTEVLRQAPPAAAEADAPGADLLDEGFRHLAARFDPRRGGFGTAPKFPTPHHLSFLLRYWRRTGEAQALSMVEQTLQAMRKGGIFDQIGFGFHRYSTDEEWLVPHFEKMLYDQAMLCMAYTEAYQATGNRGYRRTAEQILGYVLRDLTGPEGGFYSAEDADSEGVEGRFYVWTQAEIEAALSAPPAAAVCDRYGVEPGGNFADEATGQITGANILHLTDPHAAFDALVEELARDPARQALFERREQRVRPALDDKILTDWNGLMIAALAKAARGFGEEAFARAAHRAATFVLDHLRDPAGRLLHRYRNGHAGLQANLEDYAFLSWGLIELYETAFDVQFLEEALRLTREMIDRFEDREHGGFFLTPHDGEALILRNKEVYDGALPSGNSVALSNLSRLARMTGDPDLEDAAWRTGRFLGAQAKTFPSGQTAALSGIDFLLGPTTEVVVVGEPDRADTRQLIEVVRSGFAPERVVLFRPSDDPAPPIMRLAPYTLSQQPLGDAATVYVCRDFACERPVSDPVLAQEMLAATLPRGRKAER